jgi:adenosylcobinamide kinase / adenosylcobinamide-phosphate guanylyltransferase
MPDRVLVIGGQRSGKSRYAEELVIASGLSPVYLATAASGDGEMRERIALHRARRGEGWRTVEEPLDLAGALARESGEGFHVLVDCLTLWVSNLLAADRPVADETGRLLDALARVTGPVALVSGEVGLGVIPDNALARRFADALGVVNQRVAAVVDRVVLVAAGLPLVLKAEQPNSEVSI